jgi:ADP-heptose synthase, bifunctional sugar kinase/adenylyltransferase
MSNEEPSLVVSPVDKKKFVGGAGIVAAHAAGLGAKVDLITILGNDKNNIFVKKKLNEYKVSSTFFVDHARPTTLKQRYRCSGKTLLKVSHLHQNSISKNLQKKIFNKLSSKIKKYDLIVFSDFNYGCLPSELVEKMISLGKKNKKFMVADCQSSSQIGDLLKYKKMNLITPTEREARICTKNNDDGLVVLAEDLRKKLFAENIILKLGKEGVIIHSLIKKFPDTDQIEALNLSPEDSAGAGDSLLISSAMSLVSRRDIWESAYLGSFMFCYTSVE